MADQITFNDKVENGGANADGQISAADINQIKSVINSNATSGEVIISRGNTASRPSSPAVGQVYFDSDLAYAIQWDGAAWQDFSNGGDGGGYFTEEEADTVKEKVGNITITEPVDLDFVNDQTEFNTFVVRDGEVIQTKLDELTFGQVLVIGPNPNTAYAGFSFSSNINNITVQGMHNWNGSSYPSVVSGPVSITGTGIRFRLQNLQVNGGLTIGNGGNNFITECYFGGSSDLSTQTGITQLWRCTFNGNITGSVLALFLECNCVLTSQLPTVAFAGSTFFVNETASYHYYDGSQWVDTGYSSWQESSKARTGEVAYGTTAERPASPEDYYVYYDTDLGYAVIWDGSSWSPFTNGGGSGNGATTAFAWNPLADGNATGTNGTYLELSSVPSDFLINGSSWSFAVRIGSSTSRSTNLSALFSSDVIDSGVAVQTGAGISGYTDQDLALTGMTETDYNGSYTISSSQGYWANFDSQYSIGLYRIYKKTATGGFHVIVNDANTGSWIVGFTTVDPDTWVNGTSYTISSSEVAANFSSSDGFVSIPWSGSPNVVYSGGTPAYTNYWAKQSDSNYLLDMDNDVVVEPNSWLVFSFDSSSGEIDAWIGDTKTNTGTAASFGTVALSSVVFGQEAGGYDSAYFYQLLSQVTDIMIATGATFTDAEAAEFISEAHGIASLTSGLQAKITNAWTFDSEGPVTDKGSINLTSNSTAPAEAAYTEVVIPSGS